MIRDSLAGAFDCEACSARVKECSTSEPDASAFWLIADRSAAGRSPTVSSDALARNRASKGACRPAQAILVDYVAGGGGSLVAGTGGGPGATAGIGIAP